MSVQSKVWGYLKGKGLPEKSIAAVMGNIEAESGFNINLIEKGSGIGFGLCQWSFGRRAQLERYGTSLDHQLNFMWAELSGTGLSQVGATFQWIEKSGYIRHPIFMNGNATLNQLTSAMCFCWERPNKALAHLDRRQKAAQNYYNQFTGSTGEYTPNLAGSNQVPQMEIEQTNYQVVKGSEKTGDYLFGRKYRITVSDDKGRGVDVSELHCKFSILKTMQMEPNFSEITIYNLNAKTENNIRTNGTRVTVEAGYEGNHFGLIFDGDIIQCIQEKENANTYKLIIVALDSDRAINMDVSSFSILRGQSHREIVNTIVNTAKHPMKFGSISDKLNGTKLTRGKVFFGKSSDYLNQIAKSNGLKFYMDDGRVNLIDLKEPPKNEIIKLNAESGLIGVPNQSEYGISGTSLLNPQIKLNSLIHINNRLIRDKRIDLGTHNTIPNTGSDVSNAETSGGQLGKGGYTIPYNGNFKITSHFGPRWGRNHDGIDIGMPTGTYIYASKAGKVLKAGVDSVGVNSGGGKLVRLLHPDGSATNYYHLSSWKVNTGDQVRQGQLIGLSGNTGDSTGPHLHFEVKENGKFIDPFFIINGSKSGIPPNTQGIENNNNDTESLQYLMRALDKDGVYRVIKLEYLGDTRGNDWYVNFETITQVGGVIPMIPM